MTLCYILLLFYSLDVASWCFLFLLNWMFILMEGLEDIKNNMVVQLYIISKKYFQSCLSHGNDDLASIRCWKKIKKQNIFSAHFCLVKGFVQKIFQHPSYMYYLFLIFLINFLYFRPTQYSCGRTCRNPP